MKTKEYILIEDLTEEQKAEMFWTWYDSYTFNINDFWTDEEFEEHKAYFKDMDDEELICKAAREWFNNMIDYQYEMAIIEYGSPFIIENENFNEEYYYRYLSVKKRLEVRKLKIELNKNGKGEDKKLVKI